MELDVTIIDFGAMQEAIQQYEATVKTISGILEAVSAIYKALATANVFTGGAATAVLAAIQQYITIMDQALQNLNKLIDALRHKLETYQAANDAAASIAGGIEQAVWADV